MNMQHNRTSSSSYRNAGKKWTASEEQELLANIQQYRGNIHEIADVHGRSTTAVHLRIAGMVKSYLEEHPKSVVANIFQKTEKEIDELLHTAEKTISAKKISATDVTMDEIVDRLDRIEVLLHKCWKRLSKKPSTTSKRSNR